MRLRNQNLPGILLLFFTTCMAAQNNSSSDSLQLIDLFKRTTTQWKDAYNSKDSRNLVPLYAIDAQYISSHVSGLVAEGRDKLIANFQNGMTGGGHVDSIQIVKAEISFGLATLLCKYQATNSGVTVIGRNLLVLKKVNNIWLIILHMTVV